MISRTQQWLLIGGLVVVAIGALTLGAIYQDDDKLDGAVIVGLDDDAPPVTTALGEPAGSGAIELGDSQENGEEGGGESDDSLASGPIERFLPRAGEASACSERVGVDLLDGFGAKLTINDVTIAPEDMNVNLDDNGEITSEITASRSLGHYTFQPDDNCPNGRFLRPVDNVLQVCVFRLDDQSQRCTVVEERVFDAL